MIIKRIICIALLGLISTPLFAAETNLASTKVIEGLKGQIDSDGKFSTLTFSDDTTQSSAGLSSPLGAELDAAGQVINDAELKAYYDTTVMHLNATGATNLSYANGNWHIVDMDDDITIEITDHPGAGKGASMLIDLIQNDDGDATVTWTNFDWASGTPPTIATGIGTETYVTAFGTQTGNWNGAVGISDSR